MRRIGFLFLVGSAAAVVGCGNVGVGVGEQIDDLTVQDCQKYFGNGDPFDDPNKACNTPAPSKLTAAQCAGPSAGKKWNPSWDPTKPVCFGFQGDINKTNDPNWKTGMANPAPKKCNYLQVPDADYTNCLNGLYTNCAIGGLLPGMPNGSPKGTGQVVPVTDPGPLTPLGPNAKPGDRPGATVREDCDFMRWCSNWPPKVGACWVCKPKATPVYSAMAPAGIQLDALTCDAAPPTCDCPEQ